MIKHKLTLPVAAAITAVFGIGDAASAQNHSGNTGWFYSPFSLTVNGVVNVACTSGNDIVDVNYGAWGSIIVTRGSYSRSYAGSVVNGVRAYGGAGNDTLRNHTSRPAEFDGGSGNDYLLGGSGADELRGGSGADTIRGGSGRDAIYGGYGNDTIYGDSGQDLIVTVGGGVDSVRGGYQWDNFWVDSADTIHDASSNEHSRGYVHEIASFELLKRPGDTFQPGLEPNGVNIMDPLPRSVHSVVLMNEVQRPLFGPAGPVQSDVIQGAVGDCYFMAVLSALAAKQPEHIRKMVTSLGDGTYAVRLYRNGQPHYVRVDADLWTLFPSGTIAYARPGASGAIWAAIVEKAFAFFREDAGTYQSIHGGNTAWEHHARQLGAEPSTFGVGTSPTKEQIIDWDQAGRTNLFMTLTLKAQSQELLEWIDQQLQADRPVYTGARSGVGNSMAIASDNYRRGQHQYHVLRVERDGAGVLEKLVLRDPYGSTRVLTDYARIVFLIGRATELDV